MEKMKKKKTLIDDWRSHEIQEKKKEIEEN